MLLSCESRPVLQDLSLVAGHHGGVCDRDRFYRNRWCDGCVVSGPKAGRTPQSDRRVQSTGHSLWRTDLDGDFDRTRVSCAHYEPDLEQHSRRRTSHRMQYVAARADLDYGEQLRAGGADPGIVHTVGHGAPGEISAGIRAV